MRSRDPFEGWFVDPGRPRAPVASSGTWRALVPLAAVLVILGALALVPLLTGGGTTSQPDRIAELAVRAERLRGLTLTGPIAVERLDRRRLTVLLERLLADDPDPGLSQGADDALHLLGVLTPGQSLEEIVTGGLTGQVAGLYDSKADRLYLIETGGVEATGSTVLHEIVHAIQDQRFNLDGPNFGARVEDEDAQAAAQALVEGDATEVQTRFIAEQGVGGLLGELGGALNQIEGTPADQLRLPDYLQRTLEFPYLEGVGFVQALRQEGGQALVDRAFRDPPDTTLAILEPDLYIDGKERTVAVDVPPAARGARRAFDAAFGAADVLGLTGDRDLALTWRGGRIAVDRNGRQGRVVLRIVTTDPARMMEALTKVLPTGTAVSSDTATVTVSRSAAI
jgi:hypothetical protein